MQALNYKCHYSDASTWCKYKSYEFHLFYVISIQSKHTYNTFTLNEFGPGNGLIHMDDIECTGDEDAYLTVHSHKIITVGIVKMPV